MLFSSVGSSPEFAGWIDAMKHCKSANEPSYLFGDINLHNAAAACNQTFNPNYFGQMWIGVAGQTYFNKDDGKYFHSNIYFELLQAFKRALIF